MAFSNVGKGTNFFPVGQASEERRMIGGAGWDFGTFFLRFNANTAAGR